MPTLQSSTVFLKVSPLPSKNHFSNEIRLLLYCVRFHSEPVLKSAIQILLNHPLDWSFLLDASIRHGVAGIFYQTLQKVEAKAVPEKILQRLLVYFQQSALQSMMLMQALLKLQSLFATEAIPVIPFKGPLLSAALYQNLSLRKTSDLDLLVPPQHFQQAIDLLMQAGYVARREWTFLDLNREAAYIQSRHEYSLTNGSICIDLHQTLTPAYFLRQEPSFDQLWQNRQAIPLAGQQVSSFGSEDLLIYLTIHGSKECWRALKWISDIAEFVHHYPDTNWIRVVTKAQKLGSERMLLIGFRLAQVLLELEVPSVIQQRIIADPECRILADELTLNLFAPKHPFSNKFSLSKTLLHFRMMQTAGDRLNCLHYLAEPIRERLTVFFPNNRDGAFLSLPPQLYFLYYLLRPLRLITTRLPALKQHLSRSKIEKSHNLL